MGWSSARRIALLGVAIAVVTAGCSLTVRASTPLAGGDTNGDSTSPSLSGNGRLVAFTSGATNLVPNDTNGRFDIFVRDTTTNETTRVSVDSAGHQANASSYAPFISANGRYVVFDSSATNLVPNDTNNADDVFLHDMQTGATTLLTKKADGSAAAGGTLALPEGISDDGSKVLLLSNSPDLGGGSTATQAYIVDTTKGAVTRVSDTSMCPYAMTSVDHATMTHDGSKVAYGISCWVDNTPNSPSSARLVIHDLETNAASTAFTKNTAVTGYDSFSVVPTAFTSDGETLTFLLRDNIYPHGETDLAYVRRNGVNTPVPSGEPLTGNEIGSLVVSPNGRYLMYSTPVTFPYAPENTNIVLLDTQTSKSYWVAVTAKDGSSPSGVSEDEVWSADGSTIAFDSNAPDIGDGGGYWNVYSRPLQAVLTFSPR